MKKHDLIVVGAGISGLSLAHYVAKAGLKPVVLEKAGKIGGSFDTSDMQDNDNSFWMELGAHTCYNSYQNLIEVMEDCGLADQIIPRAKVPFRVLDNGDIKSFTSQINFLELLASIPRIFGKKKTGETVATYYGSILGERNFEKIFSALFSAVPSQNADLFPADALFKKRQRRKDILKSFTLKNGLGSIADAIADQNGFEVIPDAPVQSITQKDGMYRVVAGKQEYECNRLVIACSLPAVPELISEFAPDIADKISTIKYQSVESMGVVVGKDDVELKPFAGLVPTHDDFYSVVSRDTVPHEKYRGFSFHFKPGKLSKTKKIDRICRIMDVKENQLQQIVEKTNIVPSLRLGHYELIAEVDTMLKGKNLFVTGNYFAGLSIEDCVSRSKQEVQRMVHD
jgi:protoporphyrinogen oxidase